MPKKANHGKNAYHKGDLWIAPSLNLKQPARHSDWKLHRVEPSECNRFLALADVALGLAPAKHKTRRGAQK